MKTKSNNRRDFIKKSAAGIAGITISGNIASAAGSKPEKSKKVITRTLGRTGIELPVVSLGWTKSESVIKAALEAGIKHFDTAQVYESGVHEERLGKVLAEANRDSFTIATKIRVKGDKKTGLFTEESDWAAFDSLMDESLTRLQMKYVDILYIHGLSKREAVLHPELIKALQKLKDSGKTRAIGVSTHKNEPEVIEAAIEAKIYDVVLTSYNFKQPHLDAMHKAIDKAYEVGIGLVAMKTQAGAFWDSDKKHPIHAKAALKWAMKNEKMCTAIPRVDNLEQLNENFSINYDVMPTAEEEKELKKGEELGLAGLYCSQCEECLSACQKNTNIPSAMRAYMYAYGYGDMKKSKEALLDAEVSESPCKGCDQCRINCPMGFDVKQKLADISGLVNIPDRFLV